MWGLLVLFAVEACGQEDLSFMPVPPYVQSRSAFTHTRLYLQESVPKEPNDITDPEARKHFAFGIMAGVTGNIALNYSNPVDNWLNVLDKAVPMAWVHYDFVSSTTNRLLSEANLKIHPVTNLIDALCSTTDSVAQCNAIVHNKIVKSDQFIQNRARLLLALGVVSDTITSHEHELNTAAADYTVVPYLLKNVKTESYVTLIRDLENVYLLLRKNDGHY